MVFMELFVLLMVFIWIIMKKLKHIGLNLELWAKIWNLVHCLQSDVYEE